MPGQDPRSLDQHIVERRGKLSAQGLDEGRQRMRLFEVSGVGETRKRSGSREGVSDSVRPDIGNRALVEKATCQERLPGSRNASYQVEHGCKLKSAVATARRDQRGG
jgi:hypothetical protein